MNIIILILLIFLLLQPVYIENITLDGSKRQLDQQQNVFLSKHQLEKSNQLSNGHAIGLKDEFVNQTIAQDTFRQPLAQIDANGENKLNQTKLTGTVTNAKVYGKIYIKSIISSWMCVHNFDESFLTVFTSKKMCSNCFKIVVGCMTFSFEIG